MTYFISGMFQKVSEVSFAILVFNNFDVVSSDDNLAGGCAETIVTVLVLSAVNKSVIRLCDMCNKW